MDFIEDLSKYSFADQLKTAAQEVCGERAPTKDEALSIIEEALDSTDEAEEFAASVLEFLLARDLAQWCVDLGLDRCNKEESIEILVEAYFDEDSDEEDEDEDEDEPDDESPPAAFDVEWFVSDLGANATGTEIRTSVDQFAAVGVMTKQRMLDLIEDKLSELELVKLQERASLILYSLRADTLKDWCSDYDLRTGNKAECAVELVELYTLSETQVETRKKEDAVELSRNVRSAQYRQSFELELKGSGTPVTPRQYQKDAITAARKACTPGNQFQVHVPTGGGKTLIGCEVALGKVREGVPVLWVTKDWRLLSQAAKEFVHRGARIEDLGRIGGSGKELHPLPDGEGLIRFTTLQTLGQRGAAALRFKPGLVVWDECHWGDEAASGRNLLSLFAKRNVPVFGLTATPKDGRLEVVYSKSFADLVSEKYLARPEVVEPVKTDTHWAPTLNQFKEFDTASLRQLSDDRKRNQRIVEHWLANAPVYGKSILFACFVEHADHLAELFTKQGVAARVVHSQMDAGENRDALDDFREGKVSVLINVAMLTHGVDVPDAKTVLLTRPTASDILFAQMVGRASRIAPGKTSFNIVEFTDNIVAHSEHLYTGKHFYTGAGFGQVSQPMPKPTAAPPSTRPVKHAFDPTGKPTWISTATAYPELQGLWYRHDQSFGIELEITRDDYSEDMSEVLWLVHAEDLRQRLVTKLGNRVATAPLSNYLGTTGGKDYSVWHVEKDISAGWEITSPILKNEEGFAEVAEVCRVLEKAALECGFKVNWRTGFHLHLGWHPVSGQLNVEMTKRLLQLARLFEPALATMVGPSRVVSFDGSNYDLTQPNLYCAPTASLFTEAVLRSQASLDGLKSIAAVRENRYVALNLVPLFDVGTVEVRLHGGTMDASKVLLWTSLWQQLLWAAEYCSSVETASDYSVINPNGDIIALAKKYLPDARQPDQLRFLQRLDARRNEVATGWRNSPSLSSWLSYPANWQHP